MKVSVLEFPEYSGTRCLMMPYVQGDPSSVPNEYDAYREIIATQYIDKGARGFLTIDESPVKAGSPHRGARAKYGRALHTEAGWRPAQYGWVGTPTWGGPSGTPTWGDRFTWGGSGWGSSYAVTLDPGTEILLANSLDSSCALWEATHLRTSFDGDIGDQAHLYPYEAATLMQAGEVHRIGILTPHESLPVHQDCDRQFLRIVGSGVRGREEYFTRNPLLAAV